MEDVKKNENCEKFKELGKKEKTDDIIDFVLKPVVKIERDRYDELIRKEEQLNMVLKAVKHVRYSSDIEYTIKWILSDDASDGEGEGEEE